MHKQRTHNEVTASGFERVTGLFSTKPRKTGESPIPGGKLVVFEGIGKLGYRISVLAHKKLKFMKGRLVSAEWVAAAPI